MTWSISDNSNCGGCSRWVKYQLLLASHWKPNSPKSIKLPRSRMDFCRIKGRRLLARGVSATISKRVSWLFWGILGIVSVLLVSVATIAGSSPTGSNGDKAPRGQADTEAPPGVWPGSREARF
jgi:hypothetical protein